VTAIAKQGSSSSSNSEEYDRQDKEERDGTGEASPPATSLRECDPPRGYGCWLCPPHMPSHPLSR
jgi:hypothetical protein